MKKVDFISKKTILLAILLLSAVLRLWQLEQVPVSLFGDELDVGYQAYSILKTGRDYSGNLMPIHFQSLAEWRTPLYLYSSVPTVALFGISPLGVRLPAAIFGILGVFAFYLLVKEITKNEAFALLAALLLAISPWHIQYSRAGFEVTQMLAIFMLGFVFFLKGIKNGKLLIYSSVFFALTPWVYSTAKFFVPLTLLGMVFIWRKELISLGRKWLIWSFVALLLVGGPIAYSTVFGGGAQRFSYISVFTDPTTVPEVGFARLRDGRMRDPSFKFGVQPILIDKIFHNKPFWWLEVLEKNYLEAFSTQNLFIQGDLNLRHSLPEIGRLYRFELIFLILGLVFFITSKNDWKIKTFLIFWLLSAPIPAALTRDGGTHSTRLFFMLPPIIFLVAFGLYESWKKLKPKFRKYFLFASCALYLIAFVFYQHSYWTHYPWQSERWWHAGWKEAIESVKAVENQYGKIVITSADEPPWIFFAAWYMYPPDQWHAQYPFPKTNLKGFGDVSHLGKFYFGSANSKSGIYSLAEHLDEDTLYLASAKEFNLNFAQDPGNVPLNIKMLKAITYPSGEPVFYLFTLNSGQNH